MTATMTHSASRRSLKPTRDLGSSQANQSLMVEITWTTAQVVKMTAKKDFSLNAVTMDTYRKEIVATPSVTVLAGTELYFTASSIPGYYYINRISASGNISCTCTGHSRWNHCKHQELVQAYIAQPRVRQIIEISTVQPTPVAVSSPVASETKATIATPLTPQEWIEAVKRNKAWQEAEKAKDRVKLEAVKQASAA